MHICESQTTGKAICTCKKGFVLGVDRKTCVEESEFEDKSWKHVRTLNIYNANPHLQEQVDKLYKVEYYLYE